MGDKGVQTINMKETPCGGGKRGRETQREREGTQANGNLEELRPKHRERKKRQG